MYNLNTLLSSVNYLIAHLIQQTIVKVFQPIKVNYITYNNINIFGLINSVMPSLGQN